MYHYRIRDLGQLWVGPKGFPRDQWNQVRPWGGLVDRMKKVEEDKTVAAAGRRSSAGGRRTSLGGTALGKTP
jgi:hypothetical protein